VNSNLIPLQNKVRDLIIFHTETRICCRTSCCLHPPLTLSKILPFARIAWSRSVATPTAICD